jgi:hypothetical protein
VTAVGDSDEVPEESRRLRSFMESGAQVVGQAAGAAVSVVVGPVLGAGAGAVLGDLLARGAREVYDRLLAPRQAARAAGALDVAFVRIDERLRGGDMPRSDGFFDAGQDGRAQAEEILEGTLLTAANAYEERKVPLLGRMYANLAFDPTVSASHANFLLRVADRVTYHQLQLLAFFAAAQSGEYEHALIRLTAHVTETGRLPGEALGAELSDLADAKLIGGRQNDGSVTATYATEQGDWGPTMLPRVALRPLGATLHRLMELDVGIGTNELDAVLHELRGE